MDLKQLVNRMDRASRLEPELYEEVEADKGSMGQAVTVVLVSSLAAGLGSIGRLGLEGLAVGTLAALIGWVIWAFLTYVIGTRLLPVSGTDSNMGETLRTIGFSSSPGVLRIVAFVPVLGPLVNFVTGIWMLVAMVVAVRQALDYESTGRAVAVCFIGWLIQLLLVGVIYAV